jgi:hypothetical protein
MQIDFWRSAGQHLLGLSSEGWLTVTPQFVRAYWARPEVQPIDSSCEAESALHAALLADPLRTVADAELEAMADPEAIGNYRLVLAFRAVLLEAGTVEGAYLRLIRASDQIVPPVFMDQLVHLIVRNMLARTSDPMRLRAAELFFRDQVVSADGERLMLADEEIIEMQAKAGEVGVSQLLVDPVLPTRQIELSVLDEANKDIYWARSDRFDTMIDFRIGHPAADALARVIEAWLRHMLGIVATVEPQAKLDDGDWRWHIGMDADSTRILNTLYEGGTPTSDAMARIVGLFRMRLGDDTPVLDRVRGRPIYLGLAMSPKNRLKMKPQNLLMNLPLPKVS